MVPLQTLHEDQQIQQHPLVQALQALPSKAERKMVKENVRASNMKSTIFEAILFFFFTHKLEYSVKAVSLD